MQKLVKVVGIAGCLGVAAIFLFIFYPGWQSARQFQEGQKYYSLGEWLVSIQTLRKARPGKLKPEQQFQRRQLIASSYVQLGCYDKALAEYQELLKLSTLNSQLSTLQYQIAQIYADKLKDPVLAYKNFKIYLKKYPDARYRKDAEVRLKEEFEKIKEYYK